jgi:hypothetical protein
MKPAAILLTAQVPFQARPEKPENRLFSSGATLSIEKFDIAGVLRFISTLLASIKNAANGSKLESVIPIKNGSEKSCVKTTVFILPNLLVKRGTPKEANPVNTDVRLKINPMTDVEAFT